MTGAPTTSHPMSHVATHAPELRLLAALVPLLEERAAIDVGAEHGDLTDSLLALGCQPVHSFEPFGASQDAFLRRFGDDQRVHLHRSALSDVSGRARIHVAHDSQGKQQPMFNTLAVPQRPTTLSWNAGPEVDVTTLAAVVADGVVPRRVGILKIDAEGHDLQILSALGDLEADVIMLEHWHDLPESLGPCPWTIEDIRAVLAPHGFHDFVFVRHTDDFSWLQWNNGASSAREWGNLVFLHERAVERMAPVVWDLAVTFAEEAADHGREFRIEAQDRLAAIEQLESAVQQLRDEAEVRPAQSPPDPSLPETVSELSTALGERLRTVLLGELHLRSRHVARRLLPVFLHPQLGRLVQHAPRPTTVPRAYLRRTPAPATGWPSVQIVTPSYGQGEFVEATVRSVLAQGYPDLRYLVQDGGSKDQTLAVLERLESPAWRWRSEPDNGQADAINRGFSADDSELMGWLNADDLLLPGALSSAAAYLANHPDVDVVYGHRLMIDEGNQQVGIWVCPPHDADILRVADYVPQETLLWRRSLWERVGGLRAEMHYALDWDLLLRFMDAGANIVRLPRFLGAFRVHAAQKTTATWDTVGMQEVAAVRARAVGRHLDESEIGKILGPYLVLHALRHHLPQRVLDATSRSRVSLAEWLASAPV